MLGPEGWHTFDQDERLVMAMSSSDRPLLDVLRDLSNRVLSHKASSTALPLAAAIQRVATANARVALAGVGDDTAADKLPGLMEAVSTAFDAQTGVRP